MRKARLGFKIHSLDGELLVEEDVDFERKEMDKEYAARQHMLKRKLTWWNNNSKECNNRRREKASTIIGKFKASRKKALSVSQEWDLTQDEWESIWINAGWVVIPGTISPSNPSGVRKTAYAIRGPSKLENTMLARKDLGDSWNIDNCYIVYRCEPLIASEYHISLT